jgi:hypothetical protein
MAGRREKIAAALFALVEAAAGGVVGLNTSSRRVRSFDQVDPARMPALFQVQTPETNSHPGENLTIRTMHFQLYLYTADNQAEETIPSQQLNDMVDAVETALAPSVMTGKLTLGDICSHCYIEGSVEYYEGISADGKSVAIIPVAVTIP